MSFLRSTFSLLNKTEESLRKQSYFLFGAKLVSFGINFMIPVLLVRTLTQTDYGLYRFSYLISTSLLTILTAGLNTSLYYFYPNERDRKEHLLGQTMFLLTGISTVGLLAYFLIIRRFLGEVQLDIALPIALFSFFLVVSSTNHHLYILEKKAVLNAAYVTGEELLRTICVLLPALLTGNIHLILWSLVFYGFVRFCFLLIYAARKYKGFWRLKDTKLMWSQVKYAVPFGLASAIAELGNKVDRFIVSGLAGLENFAVYSIAAFKVPMLGMFFQSVFQVGAPKLAVYGAKGEAESARKLWHKMMVKTALVAIPAVVFFEMTAEPMLLLMYTDSYAAGVLPYRIFLLTVLFQMTGYGLIARAWEKTGVFFRASIFSFIMGAGLGFLFTKQLGICGAAVSAVVSLGSYATTILIVEKKILNVTFRNWLPFSELGRILLVALVSALPLIALNRALENRMLLIALDFIVYAALVIVLYDGSKLLSLGIWSAFRVAPKANT